MGGNEGEKGGGGGGNQSVTTRVDAGTFTGVRLLWCGYHTICAGGELGAKSAFKGKGGGRGRGAGLHTDGIRWTAFAWTHTRIRCLF